MKYLEELTKENCLDTLRKRVMLRDKMGSVLWQNIINDQCHMIADRCVFKFNYDFKEVQKILKG